MDKNLFDYIFDLVIYPKVEEMVANNSLIKLNDKQVCKRNLYNEYCRLNDRYKEQIFGKNEKALLDRHKIAACVCGAFLKVPVLNKTKLVDQIVEQKSGVEVYFYYVNEIIALFAASKFLSFFMVNDRLKAGDQAAAEAVFKDFPLMPPINKNKKGFWSSVLFNLSEIKDESQIGIEHYDMYSYAMFFYWLENYYNETKPARV